MSIDTGKYHAEMPGIIISITNSRSGGSRVYGIELTDTAGCWEEYMQILYDRVPTMPQSLRRDLGLFLQFWNNLVRRLVRTGV